jgi:hypothetical protein
MERKNKKAIKSLVLAIAAAVLLYVGMTKDIPTQSWLVESFLSMITIVGSLALFIASISNLFRK